MANDLMFSGLTESILHRQTATIATSIELSWLAFNERVLALRMCRCPLPNDCDLPDFGGQSARVFMVRIAGLRSRSSVVYQGAG